MKLKLFTFKFSHGAEGFDDTLLQEFLADKEAIEQTDHFFVHEGIPYLTLIVAYRDIAADERRGTVVQRRQEPADRLDQKERQQYDALRNWRSAAAKQQAIPAYLIATNRQLVKFITMPAVHLSDLLKVEGFGEAKCRQYGAAILQVLGDHKETTPDEQDPQKDGGKQ